jgi:hypothetical protein
MIAAGFFWRTFTSGRLEGRPLAHPQLLFKIVEQTGFFHDH